MELGKLAGGREFSLLAQGGAPITMVFGIPKTAVKAAMPMQCCAYVPAVWFEVLPDLDTDPNTITFNTAGGLWRVCNDYVSRSLSRLFVNAAKIP